MKSIILKTTAFSSLAASIIFAYLYYSRKLESEKKKEKSEIDFSKIGELNELDAKIIALSNDYLSEATELLKSLINFSPNSQDPLLGTSNHEESRLLFLKNEILRLGAVLNPNDISFDPYGNLVWTILDPDDPIPINQRKVIYLNAHADISPASSSEWNQKIDSGIDPYLGITDIGKVNFDSVERELGIKLPPARDWNHLIFGAGATTLQGLVSIVFASKILIETRSLSSLRGTVVRAVASVSCEVNPPGSAHHILQKQRLEPFQIPDCILLSSPSFSSISLVEYNQALLETQTIETHPLLSPSKQAKNKLIQDQLAPSPFIPKLQIYTSGRGRCELEIQLHGKSCLETGVRLVSEGIGKICHSLKNLKDIENSFELIFTNAQFTGCGSVPVHYSLSVERRLSSMDDSLVAVKELENFQTLKNARKEGFLGEVRVKRYTGKTWKGILSDNLKEIRAWTTPTNDIAVKAAIESFRRTGAQGSLSAEIGETQRGDGCGYVLTTREGNVDMWKDKAWINEGKFVHPPMIGFGAGNEKIRGKVGEFVDSREIWAPIAMMARFPSVFSKMKKNSV